MQTEKRILLMIVFFLSARFLPAGSMWGVNLNLLSLKAPTFSSTTVTMDQTQKIAFWFRGMASDALKFELDGGVGFGFGWNFVLEENGQFSSANQSYNVYPILNKFYFYGGKALFAYKIGRYMMSDPGNLILNTPIDGIDLSLNFGTQSFILGAGFTGLQFNQSIAVSMTQTDLDRAESKTLLATPRIIEYLSWTMPSNLWLQPKVFVLAMQDLSSDKDLTQSEKFHSMYLELSSRGFLGKSFIYELALAGQLGYYGTTTTVLAGSGNLKFSWLPNPKIQVGVEGIASTGDNSKRTLYELTGTEGESESQLSQYLPISSVSSRGYALSLGLGNVISATAFFKYSLSKAFIWELKTTTFLRPVDGGVVSTTMVGRDVAGAFIGQEALIGFSGAPSANFRWNVKVGALFYGDIVDLHSVFQNALPVIPRVGFDLNFQL